MQFGKDPKNRKKKQGPKTSFHPYAGPKSGKVLERFEFTPNPSKLIGVPKILQGLPGRTSSDIALTQTRIAAFNDLQLNADIVAPRKTGEHLVAPRNPGKNDVLASYLHDSTNRYDADLKYGSAPGRDAASGKLRTNTENFIKSYTNAKTDTSNLENQAQHVVPFSVLRGSQKGGSGLDIDVNSEHPFNSQILPNNALFSSQLEHASYPSSALSGGASDVVNLWQPQSTSFTGSFHQGYHTQYNKAMQSVIHDHIANAMGGKGSPPEALQEQAVFTAMRGGRRYGQQMLPIYHRFKPESVMPLFDLSNKSHIDQLSEAADDKDAFTEAMASVIKDLGRR